MVASSAKPLIPKGLSDSESVVYEKLIGVAEQRKKSGQKPRPIVVITDVGTDYDHLAALVVLKELHRLGLVEFRALIVNLMPADKRACFARAALDSLGLSKVPVAYGTCRSLEDHEELKDEMEFHKVEFSGGDFVAPEDVPERYAQDLLHEFYKNAKTGGEKLHLLFLSPWQDIDQFLLKHSDLVAKYTARVHYISDEGKLEPDRNALNNCFNSDAVKPWHSFIQGLALLSDSYNKVAAFAAPFTQDVFVKLEATGHPIGAYLRRVQKDAEFKKRACKMKVRATRRQRSKRPRLEIDPNYRFLQFVCRRKGFLANKINWQQRLHLSERDALPKGEEIIPYLTEIVLYYVHAALGVAGKDVVDAAGKDAVEALKLCQSPKLTVHRKLESQPAMSSLLKGALLDAVCDFCDRIDFEAAGFHETGFDCTSLFDQSRSIQEVLKNSKNCMFCREVAISFRDWSRGRFDMQTHSKNEMNRAHYQMVPAKVKQQGCLIRMQVTLSVLSRATGACDLVLHFQRFSQDQKTTVKDSYTGRSPTDWGIEQQQAYSGRIRPSVVDPRLFCKWIETCCAMHLHPQCGKNIHDDEEEPLTSMALNGLRLIDVENMCVVDRKDKMRYTALSYVWGRMAIPEQAKLTTLNTFGERKSLESDKLPKTIGDAIEVTKSLGFQYIWIDCLCILQDDEDDKRYFIPRMDKIFGCALVTIVAASGDNADAGLAGVRPNTRTPEQVSFMVKGVSLVRTLDPERRDSSFDGYLKDSEWCKRAWTFQEKLLSGRALIFTEEQVYWECQKATWCEDGFWETTTSPVIYRHCFGDKDYCHPWDGSFERRYRKMVEEYSGRMLTYESNRHDAFEGILKRFPTYGSSRHFLWALPKWLLSKALTWRCEEFCPQRRRKNMPPSIYSPFPSWSWLGWGKVCFNIDHGRLDAKTVDLEFYYFIGEKLASVNQCGTTQSLFDMRIRRFDDKTVVHPKDIPVGVKPYIQRDIEREQSNILFFWSSAAKLLVRHEVDLYGSDKLVVRFNGKVVPTSFWFHKPLIPLGHEGLPEFEFVVIGKFAEFRKEGTVTKEDTVSKEDAARDENLLAVLLISWENGVAHRKGLVHIDTSVWVKLDNRVWKMICLG